jgi:hypothetical protein
MAQPTIFKPDKEVSNTAMIDVTLAVMMLMAA